jgi:hypothetical protein
MGIEYSHVLGAVLVGLGATLITDLWALFLGRIRKLPPPSFCLIGRWIHYMPTGTFIHSDIAAAAKKSAECATGWLAHYIIGITFALTLVTATSGRWLDNPSLLPALLFGIGTVVFPFLIMQPSLGQGLAASKSSNPTQARLKSLMTHAVFGIGLYISALLVSFLLNGQT